MIAASADFEITSMEDIEIAAKSLQTILMHAAYGRAMMAANSLESKLVTFLMCHAVENDYSIPGSIKRMTLGALVKEFVTKYAPAEEIVEELDNMVFFRNELAHRICETVAREATDDQWKGRVIDELTTIEEFFRDTHKLLDPYLERIYQALELSAVDLLRIAKDIYPGIQVSG